MANHEGYCVKCREKRKVRRARSRSSPTGVAPQGTCPVCGAKMNRILCKAKV